MAKLQTTSRSTRRRGPNRDGHPLYFLIPAGAVILVFFVTPTLFNFVYAFTDWSSYKSDINFVGIDNFVDLLKNGSLLADLRITLTYALLVTIFQNLFGLSLALLLERDSALNRILRTAFFVPVIMSALAVGYVFRAMLQPTGAVNEILSWVAGTRVEVPWLSDNTWTLLVLALIHSWKWMGLSMLIYLAGLKTINSDVLEAGRIDGANSWQAFRHIKLPLLAPAITFNVATAMLGSLNSFDVVQATTQGGPGGTTELINIYIYRIFGQGFFAQATTLSLLLLIIVLIIALPLITVLRKREERIS